MQQVRSRSREGHGSPSVPTLSPALLKFWLQDPPTARRRQQRTRWGPLATVYEPQSLYRMTAWTCFSRPWRAAGGAHPLPSMSPISPPLLPATHKAAPRQTAGRNKKTGVHSTVCTARKREAVLVPNASLLPGTDRADGPLFRLVEGQGANLDKTSLGHVKRSQSCGDRSPPDEDIMPTGHGIDGPRPPHTARSKRPIYFLSTSAASLDPTCAPLRPSIHPWPSRHCHPQPYAG